MTTTMDIGKLDELKSETNDENNYCRGGRRFSNGKVNACYETLNKIAVEYLRVAKHRPKHCTKTKKAVILQTTKQHINFLEKTLKKLVEDEDQNSALSFRDYQRKFVEKMENQFPGCLPKKKKRRIKYCFSEEELAKMEEVFVAHPTAKSPQTNENSMTIYSSQDLLSPTSEITSITFKINSQPLEMSQNSQNSLELASKPKCSKNLEKSFNQVEDFDGFHKFYDTITNLLEQVIPFSIITSECSKNLILTIWSQLPTEHQTKFIVMAAENGNKNGVSQDSSQKQDSLPLFQEIDYFPASEDNWNDLPDLKELCASEFNFEDLTPIF